MNHTIFCPVGVIVKALEFISSISVSLRTFEE